MCCALVASPPCSTFSCSRSSGLPGPQPLRSRRWPRGFPWLTPRALQSVKDANIWSRRYEHNRLHRIRASRRLGETDNRCRPSIYLAVEYYPRPGRAGGGEDRSLDTVRLGDRLPRANKVVGSVAWYRKDSDGFLADLCRGQHVPGTGEQRRSTRKCWSAGTKV